MKTTVLLFFLLASMPLFSQYTLHFDASGKLTGEPPEKLKPYKAVHIELTCSQKNVDDLINESAKKYLSLYQSFEFADTFFGANQAADIRNECLYHLLQIRSQYVDQLNNSNRAEFAKLDDAITAAVKPGKFNLPELNMLLKPDYIMEVAQFDSNGKQLGKTTTDTLLVNTFQKQAAISYKQSKLITVAEGFDRFEVQVRKQNFNWQFFQQKKPWISPSFSAADIQDLEDILQKSKPFYETLDGTNLAGTKREIIKLCDPLLTKLTILFPGSYGITEFQKHIDSIFAQKKTAFNWTAIFKTSTEKHSFKELNLDELLDKYLKDYNEQLKITIKRQEDIKAKVNEIEMQLFLVANPKFRIFKENLLKYSKQNDFDVLFVKAKEQYAHKQENPGFEYDPKFIEEIQFANGFLKQEIMTQLEKINAAKGGQSLRDALLQQLWLSNAGWSELNIIQKVRKTESTTAGDQQEKSAQTSESLTSEIAVLQAQIDYLNALSKNLIVHTKGDSLPAPDQYLKLIKDLHTKKEAKNAELKELEKTGVSSVTSATPLAAKLGLETSDFFLNKVVFGSNLMHHIDGSEKQFMNKKTVKEIDELTVLDIFVHNDKAATDYVFQYSFEKITKDITSFEEELTFDVSHLASGSDDPKVFLQYYLLLKIYKEVVASQFTKTPPKTLPRSEKPRFQTNEVNSKIKPRDVMEVPGKVTYTVLNPISNKDTIAQGAYRINKLYRFRYKIGPSYSWLTQRDYTLNDDQTYTLDEKNAGLQTVFGLQYYFLRNDIRKQEPKRQSFAFLGLNIGKEIVENIYLGVGYEIVDGMSITAGFHFGMTEKLYSRNGILAINNRAWATPAPFITLGFDHGIFNALFKNNVRTSTTTIFK